jgi:hypothetical protein
MFNEGGYWEQARSGKLRQRVLRNGHPSAPLAGEPYCTRSQYIAYLDPAGGGEVARVHQYLRADQSIGLSGRPDPKEIYDTGILFVLDDDDT